MKVHYLKLCGPSKQEVTKMVTTPLVKDENKQHQINDGLNWLQTKMVTN
jgi:hypothetical protein